MSRFFQIRRHPRPRCLRDQLEVMFQFGRLQYVFNFAGLIPYLGVPVGLAAGYAISFVIEPNPNIGFGAPSRYVPVLLGGGLGALLGLVVRHSIIGEYYRDADHSIYEETNRKTRKRKKQSRQIEDTDDF